MEKIFGMYPGVYMDREVDPEYVKDLNEYQIFSNIYSLETYIIRKTEEYTMRGNNECVIDLEQYALEYFIYQTTRFGVEIPKPEAGKHIEKTPSYNAWYLFQLNKYRNWPPTYYDDGYQAYWQTYFYNKKYAKKKLVEDWHDLIAKQENKTYHIITDKNKIYGIYPGSIQLYKMDLEKIKKENELDIFLRIYSLENYLTYQIQYNMKKFRMPEEWARRGFELEQYALEYLIYQTRRFGVEIPKPEMGKHIEKTPSYNAWYSSFLEYFSKFNNQKYRNFIATYLKGEDVSKYIILKNKDDSKSRKLKK